MVERVGGMEIFIKQTLETGQEVAVQSLPCDELAVVETDAAVQKQLYAVRYRAWLCLSIGWHSSSAMSFRQSTTTVRSRSER